MPSANLPRNSVSDVYAQHALDLLSQFEASLDGLDDEVAKPAAEMCEMLSASIRMEKALRPAVARLLAERDPMPKHNYDACESLDRMVDDYQTVATLVTINTDALSNLGLPPSILLPMLSSAALLRAQTFDVIYNAALLRKYVAENELSPSVKEEE